MSKKQLVGWAIASIALLALLTWGCGGGEPPTSPEIPTATAPQGATRSGTDPVVAPVTADQGTNKTTTWGSAGDGIYTADFKNKHNVEPGWATLGCFISDSDPQEFIGQSDSQRFDDTGSYHFVAKVAAPCGHTIQCDLLVTGPGGFSESQKGNHIGAEIIASHGFATNHCPGPKPTPPPNDPCFVQTRDGNKITVTRAPQPTSVDGTPLRCPCSSLQSAQISIGGPLNQTPTTADTIISASWSGPGIYGEVFVNPMGNVQSGFIGQAGFVPPLGGTSTWKRLAADYFASTSLALTGADNEACFTLGGVGVTIPHLDAPPPPACSDFQDPVFTGALALANQTATTDDITAGTISPIGTLSPSLPVVGHLRPLFNQADETFSVIDTVDKAPGELVCNVSHTYTITVPHRAATCNDFPAVTFGGALALTAETATTETVTPGTVTPPGGTFTPALSVVPRPAAGAGDSTFTTTYTVDKPDDGDLTCNQTHVYTITIPQQVPPPPTCAQIIASTIRTGDQCVTTPDQGGQAASCRTVAAAFGVPVATANTLGGFEDQLNNTNQLTHDAPFAFISDAGNPAPCPGNPKLIRVFAPSVTGQVVDKTGFNGNSATYCTCPAQ